MSFHIDHEDLRAHARVVDDVGHGVAEAASAAATVNVSGGAFGIMCGFLPPILNGYIPQNQAAIAAAAGNLSSTAEAVRAMADDYRDTDEQIAARLKALGGRA